MYGSFDQEKTIQAAAFLLKHSDRQTMSFLRILKLLYIANRESLRETGFPIVDDKVVAMDHGPVMSRAYDCLKGCGPDQARWSRYLETFGNRFVRLSNDPGDDLISEFEEMILLRTLDQYRDWEDYSIAELTHEFPEYVVHRPAPGTSRPIPVRDILEALGLGGEAGALIQDHRERRAMKRALLHAR